MNEWLLVFLCVSEMRRGLVQGVTLSNAEDSWNKFHHHPSTLIAIETKDKNKHPGVLSETLPANTLKPLDLSMTVPHTASSHAGGVSIICLLRDTPVSRLCVPAALIQINLPFQALLSSICRKFALALDMFGLLLNQLLL